MRAKAEGEPSFPQGRAMLLRCFDSRRVIIVLIVTVLVIISLLDRAAVTVASTITADASH